jgi:aldehyde dehydrogenase (NAD+)
VTDTYLNYVDGEWTAGENGETFAVHNPAATDEVVGRFQASTRADAEAAIEAAVAAQESWADTPGPERGAVLARTAERLDERREELTETLTREEGKTHDEAAPEVGRAVDIFRYYAQKARDRGGRVKSPSARDERLYTVEEPLGTVGLVTPWNYPIAIPAWKIAPALAVGNTAVFKPASLAPGVARELVAALDAAGLPDGVLNMVTGSGSVVGDAFVGDDRVDGVSFTGSSAVGNAVYDTATDDGKRVQTEMGGKNPTVVMPSADLEAAVDVVAAGAFGVTGQACTACSRAIVHTSVHDAFVEGIVERAEAIEVGDGAAGAEMGPQVTADELEGTLEYVDIARQEGATLATGGGRPDLGGGHFVEPTVFTGVEPGMRIAQEEVFGPVLSVIEVEDYEQGVAVANGVDYGLSASIVTRELGEANRFVDDVEAGVVKVNEKTTGLELHVPFGGMKNSSSNTYREQGDAGLDFFTETKTVYVNY